MARPAGLRMPLVMGPPFARPRTMPPGTGFCQVFDGGVGSGCARAAGQLALDIGLELRALGRDDVLDDALAALVLESLEVQRQAAATAPHDRGGAADRLAL